LQLARHPRSTLFPYTTLFRSTYHWAADRLQRPVIDHWWQTETGWPIAADCLGIEALTIKPGSPTKPVPGYRVRILDPASGESVRSEEHTSELQSPYDLVCRLL